MSINIPEGWVEGRLRDLCEELDVRLGAGVKPTILSVTKRGVVPQSETYDKEIASDDVSSYRVINPGEFGMAPMALYYGAIGRYRGNEPGIISPAYNVFRHKPGTDPDFLSALLRLPRMIARYDALSQGGNLEGKRKLTPFDAFEAIRVWIPPITEQRAIAATLNLAESAASKTKDLIDALANAKHATMHELLTRGTRRGQAPLKTLPARWILGRIAEGVTHIPTDWHLVTLTDVARLESGHTPSRKSPEYWGGDISWLSLADTDALDALEISMTSERITAQGLTNSSARLLPKDTVVFSRTASIGKATRLQRSMATSQDFANWVCGPRILPAYLVQVFRHMQREWERLQEGSTHKTIYMPVFEKLQILLPPALEQTKIAAIGEAFDHRLQREREALTALIERRAVLAQELLSGRVRLPKDIIVRYRERPGRAA